MTTGGAAYCSDSSGGVPSWRPASTTTNVSCAGTAAEHHHQQSMSTKAQSYSIDNLLRPRRHSDGDRTVDEPGVATISGGERAVENVDGRVLSGTATDCGDDRRAQSTGGVYAEQGESRVI
jgi:hypothetical protein